MHNKTQLMLHLWSTCSEWVEFGE